MTMRSASAAPSVHACGGYTCVPRDRASKPAGPRSIRSSHTGREPACRLTGLSQFGDRAHELVDLLRRAVEDDARPHGTTRLGEAKAPHQLIRVVVARPDIDPALGQSRGNDIGV